MEPKPEQKAEQHAEYKPTIRLEFFRHDQREKAAAPEGVEGDNEIKLTEAGREHAQEVGRLKSPHPETAIAYGSERDRVVETALRQMLARRSDITPGMTFEDIKGVIEIPYGEKFRKIKELDFNNDGTQEYKTKAEEAYFQYKNYLQFLYEESDHLAEEVNDTKSTTYSKQAGNLAKLIKKHVKIMPRWQEIVTEHPDKYASAHNELQRFLGTHGGVQESLIMKVIDKLEGSSAVTEFIHSLPDKNGFGYSEGMTVTVEEGDKGPAIILKYKDRSWELTPELLDEIIEEGQNKIQE